MGSLWFGGVLVFVCVELLLLLSGQGSALRTANTAGGTGWPVYGALIL
jgi:hypothetical protein